MTDEKPLAPDTPPVQVDAVSVAEDKVLDALMGKDPEAPKAEEKITPVEAKDAPAEEDESADSDELEKAITSLRRAKVPQTVLKKMSQREIVAMSETLAARQAETDNTFRELGELRKKVTEYESRKESIAEPPLADDLDKELTEQFDETTAKALRSYMSRATKASTEKLSAELTSMSNLVDRLLTKEIRGDLRERFPDVEDAGKWDKVRAKAETLAKTGDYAGQEDPMRAVFEDACALVLKPASSAKPKSDTSRLKENGQPATKSKQVPPRALTAEERENAALDALLDGKGREAAKAAYGG